jgi:hypothetical protein
MANKYNGSRLKQIDDKHAKCSKKNCDHLIRSRRKYAKEIKTRKRNGSGKRTRRRRRGGTRPSSAFSRPFPGKHSMRSSHANWHFSQQQIAVSKQNEQQLNETQERLVENLAQKIVELAPSKVHKIARVGGKLLYKYFYPGEEDLEDLEEKINDEIPACQEKIDFERSLKGVKFKLKQFIYYSLLMRAIALIIETKIKKPFVYT